jgi:hypothetical protein
MNIYNFSCDVAEYKVLCFVPGQYDAIDKLHKHPHGAPYGSAWQQFVQKYVSPDEEGYDANAKNGDFIDVHLRPALTEKALKLVGDQLKNWGELLPITVVDDNSTVYMFNCTTMVDCLDESRSSYVRCEYEFFPDRLTNAEVFCVRSPRAGLFCTESFKQKIEALGLTGLCFSLRWSDEPAAIAQVKENKLLRMSGPSGALH